MSDEPRPYSPTTTERAIGAWQRAQAEIKADRALHDDENAITRAHGVEPDATVHPDDLIRRSILVIAVCTAREAEARQFASIYKARQARYAKRIETHRRELSEIMSIMEYQRFKALEGTAYFIAGSPALVITDEAKIPDEYMRVTRTIDRVTLRDDLRHGAVVDGCHLDNATPSLAIRGIAEIAVPAGETAEEAGQSAISNETGADDG